MRDAIVCREWGEDNKKGRKIKGCACVGGYGSIFFL